MKLTVKLMSSLMEYLPANAQGSSVSLVLPDTTSAFDLVSRFKIPLESVQVIMLNGEFLPEEKRAQSLSDGDIVSVWPSIQGG